MLLLRCCRMTITVSNRLGGQKEGDSTYTRGGVTYGFSAQTFTGDDAAKQAQFQFDLERPTHCLLENNLADVIDRSANCTVFPIALDEDITTVSLNIFYVVEHSSTTCMEYTLCPKNVHFLGHRLGDDLVDWNSGVSVRPSVRPQKVFPISI